MKQSVLLAILVLVISGVGCAQHKCKCKPVLVVKWEHSIHNPENEEYVVEVAFNKKKGPNYDVSKKDISRVTQEEFNERYGITKDTMYYEYRMPRAHHGCKRKPN